MKYWAIRPDWDTEYFQFVSRLRCQAIAQFVHTYSNTGSGSPCYGIPPQIVSRPYLTTKQENAWRRWKRRGWKCVQVEVVDPKIWPLIGRKVAA